MPIFTILVSIIWAGSLIGIVLILRKKAPELARLSEHGESVSAPSFECLSRKAKTFTEKSLQKLLVKLHVLSMKTENRIFSWRNKSNGAAPSGKETPRPRTRDPYWRELKKSRKR